MMEQLPVQRTTGPQVGVPQSMSPVLQFSDGLSYFGTSLPHHILTCTLPPSHELCRRGSSHYLIGLITSKLFQRAFLVPYVSAQSPRRMNGLEHTLPHEWRMRAGKWRVLSHHKSYFLHQKHLTCYYIFLDIATSLRMAPDKGRRNTCDGNT